MKIEIIQEEYEGNKYNSLYIVVNDKEKIRLGTIKKTKTGVLYLQTPQKRKFTN